MGGGVASRALTPAEVSRNFDAGPDAGGLVADFVADPLTGTVPLTVTFTSLSVPTETIDSYLWDFGDAVTETVTIITATHTYTTAGVYTVSLTASGAGGSDTRTRTNYITVSSGLVYTTTHRVISYTYDSLYRLISATYSSGESYHYTYDAVGNR